MLAQWIIMLAVATALPEAHAAPFALSDVMPRQPLGRMPAFTKMPYRRSSHTGTRYGKRQIKQGLQGEDWTTSYSAEVSVGTPPQNFWLDLDTGSSDLFVMMDGFPTGAPLYRPDQSSTARRTGASGTLSFGSGNVTGDQYEDMINFSSFSLSNFKFFAPTMYYPSVIPTGASGLLGMSSKALTHSEDDAFLQTLLTTSNVESIAFSFAYKQVAQHDGPREQLAGTFTIGTEFDSSQYDGDLYTFNRANSKLDKWQLPLDSVTFNGQTFPSSTALIDTGTSLIIAPPEVVQPLYQSIPGALFNTTVSAWLVPCNSTVTWAFVFGGTQFDMLPEDIVVMGSDDAAVPDLCVATVQPNDESSWILGDSFIKNYFTGFLYGPNPSISFAALPQEGVQLASTTSADIPTPTIRVPKSGEISLRPTPTISDTAPAGVGFASTNAPGATKSSLAPNATGDASSSRSNGKSNAAAPLAGSGWLPRLLSAAIGLIVVLVVIL
ncbi:acid protease [Jaminaea rosea]|uniref:Acid protease n=1 Tax=Jaminaea rosea TaxID=1569628 RepID=A0A316V3L9_9BASI|nr:acid protease [Jaminaea rosea]PWN30793.1 acid protease [Jaminaea rosea]